MKRYRLFLDTAVAANVPSGEKKAPAIVKSILTALRWKPCLAAWDDNEENASKKGQAALGIAAFFPTLFSLTISEK